MQIGREGTRLFYTIRGRKTEKTGEGWVRGEGDSYGGDFDEVCEHCVKQHLL